MKKYILCALLILSQMCTAQTPQVSISIDKPYYGFNLIPGATRRIHARTNGTKGVSWRASGTGGATATLVPAPSPNELGVFVDVTLGNVGSSCNIIGISSNYSISSNAQVTLTATSLDDFTQTASTTINVCNPTVQVDIAKDNITAYSGQQVDIQSWVTGAVNDNVVWSQVSGPSGNSIVSASNTDRDYIFSATVAGEYVFKATSVADPSKSATAIVYVTGNPMPYQVTKNNTVPVDCSVDPALASGVYDVGAGKPYATIASVYTALKGNTVLPAGTTIRLWNTDTTGTFPSGYHEYVLLDGQGTTQKPIRLVGCADAQGNLPILDGAYATAYSPSSTTIGGTPSTLAGLYQVGIHKTGGAFSLYPVFAGPSHIIIEGLAFRNAYPTANMYFGNATTSTPWNSSSSCIRPYEGDHVTIRGNDIQDCGEGILADFNANNGWGGLLTDMDVDGNYFSNVGNSSYSQHGAYLQAFRQIIQNNHFGPLKPVSLGGLLKMRGIGDIVRYNTFTNSTNTRVIDFVEPQDATQYMSFVGYLYGTSSFHATYPSDTYPADMIAAADELFHKAYVYGNVINFQSNTPPSSATAIHYFGDQGGYSDPNLVPDGRMGHLYIYNNSVYHPDTPQRGNGLTLVDTMQNKDNRPRYEWPQVSLVNNLVYLGTLNPGGGVFFQWSALRSDFLNFGTNWVSTNWGTNNQNCATNTAGECYGSGWPYITETTEYTDGSNLPAHISGFNNVQTGTTLPFDTTTFAPTTAMDGDALPAAIANMPVRFQKSPSGFALLPRVTPNTLGALDTAGAVPPPVIVPPPVVVPTPVVTPPTPVISQRDYLFLQSLLQLIQNYIKSVKVQ